MSKELNEFGKLMQLAQSEKYKDNQAVTGILSIINYNKFNIDTCKRLLSLKYEAYFKGLEGEVGYTPFGYYENTEAKLITSLSIIQQLAFALNSVLVSLGEESSIF